MEKLQSFLLVSFFTLKTNGIYEGQSKSRMRFFSLDNVVQPILVALETQRFSPGNSKILLDSAETERYIS